MSGGSGPGYKAKTMTEAKLTPAEVVMRSIESGRNATAMGDYLQAVRILKSVDDLCQRSEAPPTVHGLGLRVLSDALLLSGQVDEARDALVRGIKMNEEALKRPGLPEFLRLDVSARIADLCAALGEIERQGENWKEALRYTSQIPSFDFSLIILQDFVFADDHFLLAQTMILS
mmetsp:Transcript_30403/g.58462  ORF Transcript_30403/g.58462 Transcript_30403/m.58462 type:complete len:174 (-) Transcript_30403:1095-1616(-)